MNNYTNTEQSKKLLELGLSPETADMSYGITKSTITGEETIGEIPTPNWDDMSSLKYVPCWSVGALLQLMPRSIRIVNTFYGYELYVSVIGFTIDWWDVARRRKLYSCDEETLIDACYKTVVWLLENGYIQKQGFTVTEDTKITEKEIERKFRVGDWIVGPSSCKTLFRITGINDESYQVGPKECILFENEKFYRRWSLNDISDGDILVAYEVDQPKMIFINKGSYKKGCALSYYCYYNTKDVRFDNGEQKGCIGGEDILPATELQKDELSIRMKNAGYVWDGVKKELVRVPLPKFNIGDTVQPRSAKEGFGWQATIEKITDTQYEFGKGLGWWSIADQDDLELVQKVELSDFEEAYLRLFHKCESSDLYEWRLKEIKHEAQELLKYARKQIVSELDVDDIVDEKVDSLDLSRDGYFATGAYRSGVIDTIKRIKEG